MWGGKRRGGEGSVEEVWRREGEVASTGRKGDGLEGQGEDTESIVRFTYYSTICSFSNWR